MKLFSALLLCLASAGCAVVALPVAAVGVVGVTAVKTTGAVVTAPFDDDDEEEERESRRKRRSREEARRAETYPYPYPEPVYYHPVR